MAQFGRPSTDTTRTAWTEDDGTTASIFDQIDEISLDDADYIKTAAPPGTNVYVTKLTSITDPAVSTGHVLRTRYAKDVAGGSQINLTVELRQGYVSEASQGTLIATRTFSNISNSFTTDAYTLSGAEADAITDYSDLYMRFVATQV